MTIIQADTGIPSPAKSTNHEAVTRILAHALTLGDAWGWEAFSAIAQARLEPTETAALAFAALRAQDQDDAALSADAAINSTVHPTRPSFIDTEAGRRSLIEWREQRDRRRVRR